MKTALILAGGESRRLGRPKALVEIGGRPLITRVAAALSAVADETVVSVADRPSEELIGPWLPHATFVRDERRSRGPIEGFRQGFRVAHGDVVLVAPCDAPFLRPELYRLLLEALGTYDAAVPKTRVLDPIRAAYRRNPVNKILEMRGTLPSPSALVDHLKFLSLDPERLRVADPPLLSFFDVNTRSDLDDARSKIQFGSDRLG